MLGTVGQNRTKCRSGERRGAVVVVAIVCLVIASVLFLTLLRTIIAQRDTVQTEAWRVQAAWLAESGLERAAAQLAKDPAYRGETWTIPADLLDSHNAAVVTIEIQPAMERPHTRLVRVRADFPDHPQHRARQTKEALVSLPPSS